MQADADIIHHGVTTLSYARSDIHGMCGRIEQAVKEAASRNINRKFSRCESRILEIVKQMRQSAEELTQMGQTLERLEVLVRSLNE